MKKVLAVLLAAIFALSCLSGCREQPLLDPHDPVVLTLWHTYGEQADSPMNRLIDRFNSTVGMERGVVIRTTLITVAAKISDRLAEAQDGTPGAVPLPDLFFCHNNDAAAFGADRRLCSRFPCRRHGGRAARGTARVQIHARAVPQRRRI